MATGDVLFLTDTHAHVSVGWDAILRDQLGKDDIIAGSVAFGATPFKAHGGRLVAPAMGMSWNTERPSRPKAVEIAPSAATGLKRSLFERLGGYDAGFVYYGAAEPEFSVRAWLMGAKIKVHPKLEVTLGFRPRLERETIVGEAKPFALHNALRFGLLYMSDPGCLQLLRYHARKSPRLFPAAVKMVDESDVWSRRAEIEKARKYDFNWFAKRFDLKDHFGGAMW